MVSGSPRAGWLSASVTGVAFGFQITIAARSQGSSQRTTVPADWKPSGNCTSTAERLSRITCQLVSTSPCARFTSTSTPEPSDVPEFSGATIRATAGCGV